MVTGATQELRIFTGSALAVPAQAIARQVRLRQLGGGIVVDFVGLEGRGARDKVRQAMLAALADDPAKPQILGWTRPKLRDPAACRQQNGVARRRVPLHGGAAAGINVRFARRHQAEFQRRADTHHAFHRPAFEKAQQAAVSFFARGLPEVDFWG